MKRTLQQVFDACEKLDDEIYAEADAARQRVDPAKFPLTFEGSMAYSDASCNAWADAHDAGKKARQSQFKALQLQCGEISGHIFEANYCMVCSAEKYSARKTADSNLLKLA